MKKKKIKPTCHLQRKSPIEALTPRLWSGSHKNRSMKTHFAILSKTTKIMR